MEHFKIIFNKSLQKNHELIIPAEVEYKIRLACSTVYNVEWSGVLFFSVTGTFEDKITITCKDILVMDVGNTTYTEWEANPDIINYMVENNLLDCQMGIIHSHHSMSTTFSNTDINTLKLEGINRNTLVSLIVNNEGTYNAAITRFLDSSLKISEEYKYKFFNSDYLKGTRVRCCNSKYVEYTFLNIITETNNNIRYFSDRIIALSNKKSNKKFFKKEDNNLFSYSTKPLVTTSNSDLYDSKVKSTVAYIITGSIFCPYDSEELQKWIKTTMVASYIKRFGTNIKENESLNDWWDLILDYAIYSDEYNKGMDDNQLSIFINDMVSYIESFSTTNSYLQELIIKIKQYEF